MNPSITKEKNKEEKKFLKDKVARLILNDESCREYLIHIIAASLDMDIDYVRENIKMINTKVGNHEDLINQEADVLYETDNEIINVEINYNYFKDEIVKNTCYIANLFIRNTKVGSKYKDVKRIYQINLDNYDLLKKGDFIYENYIANLKYSEITNDLLKVIDINLDFLNNLEYTDIDKLNETDLQWLLYIFVCSDKKERNQLYEENSFMRKVFNKMDDLTRNLNEDLYYDHEEYKNISAYHRGEDEGYEKGYTKGRESGYTEGHESGILEGQKQNQLEIAKNLLAIGLDLHQISKATKLSIEEIKALEK